MPRQRNPDCEKAEKLFQESAGMLTLKEIAEQLNVSEGTVRSWKNRYKWEKNSNAALQTKQKKDCNVANKEVKRGAKKGNQNALGHGAPKGNKNHLKHGLYEKMLFEFLSEQEQQFFLQHEIDEIEECKKMIKFCDLQILKFMGKIKELEQRAGGLVVSGVSKKKRTINIQKNMTSGITGEETTTNTIAVHELILRYNNEIEKAKKQKIKCIDVLLKFGEINKKEDIVLNDSFINALKQETECLDWSDTDDTE